jgi:hypothetical protein
MTGVPALLVGLLGQWGLGLAAARPLRGCLCRPSFNVPRRFGVPGAETAGLALALGIAATSGLAFLWSLAGGRLGPAFSWGLTAVGLVGGGVLVVRNAQQRHAPREPGTEHLRPAAGEAAFVRLCQWGVALLFIAALTQTLLTPQRFWDERAIFAVKGVTLHYDRSIKSADLLHRDFVQGHPRYPLLIPLAAQHIYSLLGRVDDRWAKAPFALLYLGLILTFAGVLSRHLTSAAAWLFALLLATVPVLMPYEYGFLSAQADAPAACYHGLSVLYLWDALAHASTGGPSGRLARSGLAAGLCAAAAAFTKDEGLAFLIVDAFALSLIGAAIAVRRRRAPASSRNEAVVAAPPRVGSWVLLITLFTSSALLALAPWIWHRQSLPLTNEMNYFGRMSLALLRERIDTLRWSVPHVLQRMFGEWARWGLQWWVLLLALLSAPRSAARPAQVFLLLDVLGAIAALLAAGMFAPAELREHIGGSSHRFLMQIAPVAVLFVAGQWGRVKVDG